MLALPNSTYTTEAVSSKLCSSHYITGSEAKKLILPCLSSQENPPPFELVFAPENVRVDVGNISCACEVRRWDLKAQPISKVGIQLSNTNQSRTCPKTMHMNKLQYVQY